MRARGGDSRLSRRGEDGRFGYLIETFIPKRRPIWCVLPITTSFDFDYFGTDVAYGRGVAAQLEDRLAAYGIDEALVVCGRNIGANEELVRPLTAGIGDRLAGVFDETTPDKRAQTVFDGIELVEELGVDGLIGVGGGSSLDVARQISAFRADGRSLSDFRDAAHDGTLDPIEVNESQIPVVTIPTTFAGADLSSGGSIVILTASESPGSYPVRISGSTQPTLAVFDPDLYETSPKSVLAGSAMNGFNKGLETIYASDADPFTDAAAVHGLRYLREGFTALDDGDSSAMERAVAGMILVQFRRKASVIHAVGHGFSRRYPIQQGLVHAIVAPHVLRHLFEVVNANRALLGEGLGVNVSSQTDEELAVAIVSAVTDVRDSFDLPTRLQSLDHVDKEDLQSIATFILEDSNMDRAPAALDATSEWIKGILEDAW
jgi:alcohol dehydrogenase class IV